MKHSRIMKHLDFRSGSLSLTKPHHQMRLPPHNMHMAAPFPVQPLIHKLKIIRKEEFRKRERHLHEREAV